MPREDVAQFIQNVSNIEPADELVDAMESRTEGNPLFMIHVAKLLTQSFLAKSGQDWKTLIPESILMAITGRLDRLTEDCVQILMVASVIGREFDLDQLKLVIGGLSEDSLLDAMEKSLAAGIIEEMSDKAGSYQFSHVLIQEVLSQRLSGARRARLHGDIGEAFEELYASELEVYAAKLAHHFAEAASAIGTKKFIGYSLIAGEQALSTYAHEDAIIHFERALAAKEDQNSSADTRVTDDETAEILFGLGRAQAAFLERQEISKTLSTLSRAFDYYQNKGEVETAVAVAGYPLPTLPGLMGAKQLIPRALKLVPPGSHQAGQLLSAQGAILGIEEADYTGSRQAFEEALSIALRESDLALQMQILADSARVAGMHLLWEESQSYSSRAIELARLVDNPRVEVDARFWMAETALHALGETKIARQQALAMLDPAERLRDRYRLANALWTNETISRLTGDWRSARAFSDRCMAVAPRDPRFILTRALLEFEIGDSESGTQYMEWLLDAMELAERGPTLEYAAVALAVPLFALIAGTYQEFEIARSAAAAVLSSSYALPIVAQQAKAGLALIAVMIGDIETAREQYVSLQATRGTMVRGILAADRILGLLSAMNGEFDQAAAHFEGALDFCGRAGYRPEYAWAAFDYASVLLQQGASTAHPRAITLLEEALAISSELQMHPLLNKVADLKGRNSLRQTAVVSYPDGLTQREVEVLRLIVMGKTNQEIADQLVISLNTVVHHVTNILSKTSSSNRAKAAAYAVTHGLSPK